MTTRKKSAGKKSAASNDRDEKAAQLRMDTLELLEKAISLTREKPDSERFTALTRALAAFKTADEMALKRNGGVDVPSQISPELIRLIEEELLGIKRDKAGSDNPGNVK
jgi:hypothetical protein